MSLILLNAIAFYRTRTVRVRYSGRERAVTPCEKVIRNRCTV